MLYSENKNEAKNIILENIATFKTLVQFKGIGSLVHNYFKFFARNTQCALVVALSENSKYHSVWLQEIGNSCTSVFPNTRAWEQQERNRRRMQEVRREYRKKQSRDEKKRSPYGLSHPNQNTIIIINKILQYFYKIWKSTMKFN